VIGGSTTKSREINDLYAQPVKALVEGFMSHQPIAYLLFGTGAMIALIMEMLGQPSLIFALGMYLPPVLNTPALVGGALSHWLNKRSPTVDTWISRGTHSFAFL
jgi:uncharacterized oligopeptide transporter (OPT) family protein